MNFLNIQFLFDFPVRNYISCGVWERPHVVNIKVHLCACFNVTHLRITWLLWDLSLDGWNLQFEGGRNFLQRIQKYKLLVWSGAGTTIWGRSWTVVIYSPGLASGLQAGWAFGAAVVEDCKFLPLLQPAMQAVILQIACTHLCIWWNVIWKYVFVLFSVRWGFINCVIA